MRINSYSRNISLVLCVIGCISITTTNAAEDPASLYLQFHNKIASGKVNTLEKLYTYLSKSAIAQWKSDAPASRDLHLFSYVDLHRWRKPKVVNTSTNEDGVVLTLEVRVGREPVPYTAHVLMVMEDGEWKIDKDMWEYVEYARSKNTDKTIERVKKLLKQNNNNFFLIQEENAKPDIYIQAKQENARKSDKIDMNAYVYQWNGRERMTYIELRTEREQGRYERHLQLWFLGEGIGTNDIGCKKGKFAAYGRYKQLNEQYNSWRGEISITRIDVVGGKVEGTYKVYFSAGEGSNIVIAGGFRVTRSEDIQKEKDPARIKQMAPNWCK